MKAIIVDDEQTNVDNLKSLLAMYCPAVKVIGFAANKSTAKLMIEEHQPDLLFLDIQLGKDTGFDLLKTITMRNFEVIFVTAFDHYGIQAIKFAALDYLLKPVDIDELVDSVLKAELKIRNKKSSLQIDFLLDHLKKDTIFPAKIALPQLKEIRYVKVEDILRCEADNNYTFFFLANGDKILVSKPLKEYTEMLQPYGFIRTHQSHLVNSHFVKSWLTEDGGIILLENDDRIPVSKMKRNSVRILLAGI